MVVVVRVGLIGIFLLAGAGKFDLSGNMASNFHRWGLPLPLMILTGVCELAGACCS